MLKSFVNGKKFQINGKKFYRTRPDFFLFCVIFYLKLKKNGFPV